MALSVPASGADEKLLLVPLLEKAISELEQKVESQKKKTEELQQELAALREENARLKERLAEAKAQIEKLSKEPPKAKPQTQLKPDIATREQVTRGKWAGFRGLKWATNITDTPGMVLVKESGDSKFYRREGDKLAIGEAKLDHIIYGFYKGRFYYLLIQAEGFLNWNTLRDAVFATYGKGIQPNEFIEEWWWGGLSPGVKDVMMKLVYNEIAKKASLTMCYKPIIDEEKADEAKKAKDAGKDF